MIAKKSFFIAAMSAFVQYYDYHLFGFLAAAIAKTIMPSANSLTQLMNTYLIMTLSFIAKPLGAILLGKIGDIYGRSFTFMISLAGTGAASMIIAITPSYNYIGIIGVYIILISRMITCALVSSGADGVRIYIYEHIDKNQQCLGVGLSSIFMQFGSMVAVFSAGIFTLDLMPDYAWRFGFIIGSCIGISIIYLKYKFNVIDIIDISKDDNFKQYQHSSIFSIIKQNIRIFVLCSITSGSIGAMHQFLIIFFATYNFAILQNIEQSIMHFYTTLSVFIYIIFSIVSGYVSDKFNRYIVVYIATISILILSIFHIIVFMNQNINIPLFLITAVVLPFVTIPTATILNGFIPRVIRYRIFSASHSIGSVFISAPTALVSTALYRYTNLAWLPMIYFIALIIIIYISVKQIHRSKMY